MNASALSPLQIEWTTLQQDHERHERCAIGVKIAAVALMATGALFGFPLEMAMPLTAAVWLIEAMLRTVQGRLGVRLLAIEARMAEGGDGAGAFRLHSDWQASRPGAAGLLLEYGSTALKPTVAFPHAFLLLFQLALSMRW